jgi:hypothetical protein
VVQSSTMTVRPIAIGLYSYASARDAWSQAAHESLRFAAEAKSLSLVARPPPTQAWCFA